MASTMLRGEVRVVGFDPAVGSEAVKRRPAVVVSNDQANTRAAFLGRGVVTVVPVTSNVEHVHPFQVLLPREETGLLRDSKAQAELMRSVDIERVGPVTGVVSVAVMRQLDDAMRTHLDLG
jgi:mRNA interferase MazF